MNLTTIEAITEFLFVEKNLSTADLIFVFGNDWMPTMEDVADLYHRQVSRKILISGHSARADRQHSEAVRFMRRGLELGIPDSALILEQDATNTKENIRNSIPLLETNIGLKNLSSILFVCKTFHTRRVLMTARNFLPKHIEFGFHPMIDERNIMRDNWWKEPERIERVIAEVKRIADYTFKSDLSIL